MVCVVSSLRGEGPRVRRRRRQRAAARHRHLRASAVTQLVDAQLCRRVGVFGEPDEGDGVVVDEGVDLKEVRELLGLAEAGGVLVGGVLAFAPVASPRTAR